MNKLDKDYKELLQDILTNGVTKMDRTGTGTISVFGHQIRHRMSDGFPVITTKKMYWKGIVTELIWFLRGDTSIKYLVDNDCHIWDGDCHKRYLTTDINTIEEKHKYKLPNFNGGTILYKPNDYVHLTKEEFINRIKTDDEFAKKWGELGKIYGHGWRNWNGKSDDELYDDYLKKVKDK